MPVFTPGSKGRDGSEQVNVPTECVIQLRSDKQIQRWRKLQKRSFLKHDLCRAKGYFIKKASDVSWSYMTGLVPEARKGFLLAVLCKDMPEFKMENYYELGDTALSRCERRRLEKEMADVENFVNASELYSPPRVNPVAEKMGLSQGEDAPAPQQVKRDLHRVPPAVVAICGTASPISGAGIVALEVQKAATTRWADAEEDEGFPSYLLPQVDLTTYTVEWLQSGVRVPVSASGFVFTLLQLVGEFCFDVTIHSHLHVGVR
jgi:hypothetical protein